MVERIQERQVVRVTYIVKNFAHLTCHFAPLNRMITIRLPRVAETFSAWIRVLYR
jgi:hypothetical protein